MIVDLPVRAGVGDECRSELIHPMNQQGCVMGGQSTIEVDHDHATAVTYCLAHYIKADGRGWSLTIESIHYLDGFVKRDGGVGVRRADAHGRLG